VAGRRGAQQEPQRLPQVVGLHQLVVGDAGVFEPACHWRGGEAGDDRRELDAGLAVLHLSGLGHGGHPSLGGGVEGEPWRTALGRGGADVDHERLPVLGARRLEHLERLLEGREERAQVYVEVALHDLGIDLRQRPAAVAVGGRVDEHVHAPVGGAVGVDQFHDRVGVGKVGGDGLHLRSLVAQLFGSRLELGRVAAADREAVALAGERARERLADPAAASRHERRSICHLSPLRVPVNRVKRDDSGGPGFRTRRSALPVSH
jgi:hypothetical protein